MPLPLPPSFAMATSTAASTAVSTFVGLRANARPVAAKQSVALPALRRRLSICAAVSPPGLNRSRFPMHPPTMLQADDSSQILVLCEESLNWLECGM